MYKFIGFIAAAFAILAALSIALMFYGHFNDGGMTVLAFQLWGIIATIAALLFALISRFMAKRKSETPHGTSKFAIIVSMMALLSLIIGIVTIG